MQSNVKVVKTYTDEVMDVITCDGCGKVLDMNLDIRDRNTRYDLSKQVQVVGRYFDFRHYDRYLEESIHMHLCPACMHAKIDAWCDPKETDDIEYDMESCIGKVIPEEIEALRAAEAAAKVADEAKKEQLKARHDAEKEAAIEQSVAEEEAMLNRMFGKQTGN